MATRTIYVDDLDGSDLGTDEDATVAFSFDGQSYTIDLSKKNRDALAKALDKYIAAATQVSGGRGSASSRGRSKGRGRARSSSTSSSKSESEAIREWAAAQSIEVSSRGRIAAAVRDQYLAATKAK